MDDKETNKGALMCTSVCHLGMGSGVPSSSNGLVTNYREGGGGGLLVRREGGM